MSLGYPCRLTLGCWRLVRVGRPCCAPAVSVVDRHRSGCCEVNQGETSPALTWAFRRSGPISAVRPRGDSNARTRLRRPMLYPLSYEGPPRGGALGHGSGDGGRHSRPNRERPAGRLWRSCSPIEVPMDVRDHLRTALAAALTAVEIQIDTDQIALERPGRREHGDWSTQRRPRDGETVGPKPAPARPATRRPSGPGLARARRVGRHRRSRLRQLPSA